MNGNALSGDFAGPVTTGQNVTVVVQQAMQAELPPELQNKSLRHMIVGAIAALQHLEDRIYYDKKEDEKERKERQEETDRNYDEARADRRRIWRFLLITMMIALLSLVISLMSIWLTNQLVERFGWLW